MKKNSLYNRVSVVGNDTTLLNFSSVNNDIINNAIYKAIDEDDIYTLKLFEVNNVINNYVDSNTGRTALHLSAIKGHNKLIEYLLGRGLSVSKLDNFHNTPLHYAAQLNKLNTVKLLLEGRSSTNSRNKQGKTAYDIAKEYSNEDIIKLLKPTLFIKDYIFNKELSTATLTTSIITSILLISYISSLLYKSKNIQDTIKTPEFFIFTLVTFLFITSTSLYLFINYTQQNYNIITNNEILNNQLDPLIIFNKIIDSKIETDKEPFNIKLTRSL